MSLVDVGEELACIYIANQRKPYHAYFFGTSFWYALRGMARVTDPARVSGWFRPPAQPSTPNGEWLTSMIDYH